MVRQGVWMVIMVALLSALTACPSKDMTGRGDTLAPEDGRVKYLKPLEPQNNFLGRWEAREPRTGPVPLLEFRADGTATSSSIARIYSRYSVEGDKVVLSLDVKQEHSPSPAQAGDEQSKAGAPGIEPVVHSFVLANDNLSMTNDMTGEVMDMQRIDPTTASDSIVGHWSYTHSTGVTAQMIFDANGINISKVPLPEGLEGTYEVRGDLLTVRSLDERQAQTVRFRLEDRLLVVIDDETTTYYDRVNDAP